MRTLVKVFCLIIFLISLVVVTAQAQSSSSWPLQGYAGPQLGKVAIAAPVERGTDAYEPKYLGLVKRMKEYEAKYGPLEDIPLEEDAWVEMLTSGNITAWTWCLKGTMFKGKNGQILFRADCGNPAGRIENRPKPNTINPTPTPNPTPQPEITGLSVTKTVTNQRTGKSGQIIAVEKGDPLLYEVVISDRSEIRADNIVVSDHGANGIQIEPSAPNPAYTGSLETELKFIDPLEPGYPIKIQYYAKVTASSGEVVNTVTVRASNAGQVTATATVYIPQTTISQSAPCPTCPEVDIQSYATLGEKLKGGVKDLIVTVVIGAGSSAGLSGDGMRGDAAWKGAVFSAGLQRITEFINPSHNEAKIKVKIAGKSEQEFKIKRNGSISLPENGTAVWKNDRISVKFPNCNPTTSDPRVTHNITPFAVDENNSAVKNSHTTWRP